MLGETFKTNRTVVIFLKRLIKYVLIFAVLILMIAPLYFKSYGLAKQLTVDKSNAKLQEGLDTLELQVLRAHEITNLLRQEDSFKRLFFLKGPPASEYYVDINQLHTKLKSLSLTQDMFTNVYVVFKNNPLFISNHLSSDDYENVYERYYNYEDITVEEWRELLFAEHYNVQIMPAKQVFSSYYSREYFDGITMLLNNSYFTAFEQQSVLAVDFDKRDILNKLLYEDQLDDHVAYITDNDNHVILSHNDNGEELPRDIRNLDEITIGQNKYTAITYSNDLLGMKAVIGIPQHAMEQNVNSLLELVMLYVIGGIVIIILLLLAFSMKETLWLKKLLEAASKSKSSHARTRIGNEYKYINNAFQEMNTVNEEQLHRIRALNDSIQYSVLKHLLILGVYTAREREEVEGYFGDLFDCYFVVKVSHRLEDSAEASQKVGYNIGLDIEKAFRNIAVRDMVPLNFHSDETVFVLFLDRQDDSRIQGLKTRLTELVRTISAKAPVPVTINMGLSSLASDLDHAKRAYQQAMYALSINDNDVSGGVHVYEPPAEDAEKQSFDIAIALKLYDALIAGEKAIVSQIFAGSIKLISAQSLDEQEQLQIFFSFRQSVHNACKVISAKKNGGDEHPVSVPDYDQTGDVIKLCLELKQVSLQLCDVVLSSKRSNNDKLRSDIMKYIEEQYANPVLSASSIAEELFISEKYVFSFVKEQTGKSLGKYIEEIRIGQAERLLTETDYSNSKIWKLCGFGSENTFYRAFAKKHVVSPTVWRENRRNHTD
ncbi:helix-turn-helix domain-containing protein [Paenibacillus sp. PAMC21692]|uniref:helix-turn-helix domain-containing protein n=1 Tax=Paenibacillus sp. PAMC21692 TaxID=2762320 RepID=UPI00164D680E|nr:helix-turn-helix domain-containing protein [Paenibacillus sp. PAMC21692]QNK57024.1 helix-turn-helix domain-containing protein [Paenibacillus sp. PAMC21692]